MEASSNSNSETNFVQKKMVVVDPFCYRQFAEHADASAKYAAAGGTVFSSISIADFERAVNDYFDNSKLQAGYAPFCKHLFLPVTTLFPTDTDDIPMVNVLPITPDNEHFLRTKYEARNDKELPVLIRFFPRDLLLLQNNTANKLVLPKATFLDLILYSREQIQQENAATQSEDKTRDNDKDILPPWGIVSIKAQTVDFELPMNPITVMRNALGMDQGGSGIPLDRDAYMKSVNYWKDHAVIA